MNTNSIRIPLYDSAMDYGTLYPLDCQNIIRTKYLDGFFCFWDSSGNMGLMDRYGRTILPPPWDDIYVEKEVGVIRGIRQNRTILFDMEGNPLTGLPVKELLALAPGVSVIGKNAKVQVLPNLSAYIEGLARCPGTDHTYYVNSKGRIVLQTNGYLSGDFHDGLAVIQKNNGLFRSKTYGYINKSGKVAIPMTYRKAEDFSGGVAMVQTQNDRLLITTENRILTSDRTLTDPSKKGPTMTPSQLDAFHNGYAAALYLASDSYILDGHPVNVPKDYAGYYILDNNGTPRSAKPCNLLVHSEIDDLFIFNNGQRIAGQKLFGVMNSSNQVLIPEQYTEILPLNGRYFQLQEFSKYGVADKSGRILIKPEWDRLSLARPDTINVCRNGLWGVMDYHGSTLYPVANDAQFFVTAGGVVSQDKAGNWFLLNRKLRVMTDSSVKIVDFLWFGLMLVEYGGIKYILDYGFEP